MVQQPVPSVQHVVEQWREYPHTLEFLDRKILELYGVCSFSHVEMLEDIIDAGS